MTRRWNWILVAVLIGILLLSVPASAAVVNLSQPYKNSGTFVKYEQFTSPLETATEDSAILWVEFFSVPTNCDITFTLTHNDLQQVTGSLVSKDTSLISSTITASLGGVENTTTYTHLPLVGVAPRYVLTYGVDPAGLHYLVLLPTSRTGPSPWDGRSILIDTSLDANLVVNPPLINPIIKFEKTSSSGIIMNGYTATMSYLENGPEKTSDYPGMFLGALTAGIGIFLFVGSFLIEYIEYLPLGMLLGEALLFLYCIDRKSDIVEGLGLFLDKNLYLADIVQRILSYAVQVFYWAWDAMFKWL
jgi:hypothetical protein